MIGKEIKVVLSLDDAGFSIKTKAARDVVKNLETGLGGLTKANNQTEASIADLTKHLAGFTAAFDGMQKKLQTTVTSLEGAVKGSFDRMGKQAQDATKAAKDSATAQIDARIQALNAEQETNRKLLESRGKLHSELRKLESDERAKSTAAMLAAEKAERGKKAGAQGVIATNLNEADRLERNANAVRKQIQATEQWISTERQAQSVRASEIASLEAERKAVLDAAAAKETLARISAAVGKSNAAEVARITKAAAAAQKDADLAAAKSAQDLARLKKQYADQEVRDRREAEQQMRREAAETAAAQKRAAQEAAAENRRQAAMVAEMWKGMAQAYAGAKTGQFLNGSVNQADRYEREELTAKSLNLPKDQLDYINEKAWDDSKVLKFASALDMIKARMAAIGGLGANHVETIDELLQHASKAAYNIQYITGDHSKQGFEDMIRNLFGVIEARQQVNDTEAAKRTFDLVNKIYVGTGKKIDIADLETFLRRNGPGADKISDEGLAKIVAFLDQAKVSGGGMAAGAGVSTIGTMVKMFQKMANGGLMTERGAAQFAEAGLMDLSAMDGKSGKDAMRALRQGGLTDSALANADPVGALEKIANAALAYMTKPENLKKYFPDGADVKDPAAIKDAMMKFAIGTGWSTNAVAMLTTAGNDAAMHRAKDQATTIMNSKGAEDMNGEVMKTYGANVDQFTKSWENLKLTLGTSVLPMLTTAIGAVNGLVTSAAQFFKDDSASAWVTTVALALGGATLAFKGFTSMFGGVGTLGTIFRLFAGSATTAATAAATAGTAAAASRTGWGLLGTSVTGAATGIQSSWAGFTTTMSRNIAMGELAARTGALGIRSSFTLIGSSVMATARLVGSAFLRMIPLVGTLVLAWDLMQIVANWEIGGAKVSTWLIGWGDRLITWAENTWLKVKAKFKSGAEAAQLEAQVAANNLALQDRLRANGVQTDAEKKADPKTPVPAPKPPAPPPYKPNKPAVTPPVSAEDLAAIQGNMKGKPKGSRPERDPLNELLNETLGQANAAQEKLRALIAGGETIESLKTQAYELIEGKRLADDLSKDHDKKNRPEADDKRVMQLKEETFRKMLLGEQIRGITFANERSAAAAYEADQAMERLSNNGAAKQTDAFRALSREMLRAEERLGAGTDGFKKWAAARDTALLSQARADAGNAAADLQGKNQSARASLLPTERERLAAELAATAKAEDEKYQVILRMLDATIKARRQSAIEAATVDGQISQQAMKEIDRVTADALASRDALDAEFSERRRIRREEEARQMETATQRMTREWKDFGKAVDDISANASNNFVGMLTSTLTNGKTAITDFVKGVLTDIANAKLKQVLAEPLEQMAGAGGDWLKKNVFGMSGDAAASAATTQRATADTAAATAATTLATMLQTTTFSAQMLSDAMLAAAATGGGGGDSGLMKFAASAASAYFGGGTDTGAVSNELFANGGIMTSMGRMELRKYANGGVANRPQVAIYGEGSMNEAYVPLPDGRSIPVTLSGGQQQQQAAQAPAVQVNVINQTGTNANAQQGQARFDGKAYILDVVMTAANTPGPFRSNLKEAVK